MMTLQNRIDFMLIFAVEKCNPNGDPLNSNRPRTDFDGYGEVTDVCLKRKIRNRLQDIGEEIFVQSDGRADDGYTNLRARADGFEQLKKEIAKKKNADPTICRNLACEKWIDTRAFGQVFSFKSSEVSLGIRGAVSISFARSLEPVSIRDISITKSVNTDDNGFSKDSTTMGIKYIVDSGAYVAKGSIYPELARKTNFTDEDADKIKESLKTMFYNDSSSARPSGSMTVTHLFWWVHPSELGIYSPMQVFRTVKLTPQKTFPFYSLEEERLERLTPEIYVGY